MIIIITFVPQDIRKDNLKYTFPIEIGYKSSQNNKSNLYYVTDLNKMSNLKNKFIFYCKIANKYISISILSITTVIDMQEK